MSAVARFKRLAPYVAIALVMPGGVPMALLFWLFRRRNKDTVFATDELLAFL